MSDLVITTQIKLHGCRVVGVTTNPVKGTGRITVEHGLDDELAEMLGPLGYWARQEIRLDLDLRQQQAVLPLRTDLTTEPRAEVQEVLDKMGLPSQVKKVTVTGAGRSVEVKGEGTIRRERAVAALDALGALDEAG